MLLRKVESIEKTDNGYLIHGDCADVKLVFMTDDIIRIRVSFDKQFKEASYALVTTAWVRKFRIRGSDSVRLPLSKPSTVFCTAEASAAWAPAWLRALSRAEKSPAHPWQAITITRAFSWGEASPRASARVE